MAKKTVVIDVQTHSAKADAPPESHIASLLICDWTVDERVTRSTGFCIPLDQDDATIANLLREYAARIIEDEINALQTMKMAKGIKLAQPKSKK